MRPFRFLVLLLLTLCLTVATLAANLTVNVIDVGQGDSILVQFPNGANMLVDAGPQSAKTTVVDYLRARGVKRIDILVATHPHEDHIGGMTAVLATFPVGKIWDDGYALGSRTQAQFLQAIKAHGIQYGKPRAGFNQMMGDVRIDVLAPVRLLSGTGSDANNNSIVLRLSYGEVSVLLTGDMEGAERATVSKWPHATILKVAHHGSRTGTDVDFLWQITPQYAAISYGVGNSYGHPHAETVTALTSAHVKVFRTGAQGTIVFTTDGQQVSVVTAGKQHGEETSRVVRASHSGNTSTTAGASSAASKGTDIVYITRTGKCYHRAGCPSLRGGGIPISRADAIAQEYRPCSRCNP